MDGTIRSEMKKICHGKEWRKVIEFLENGYKGIFVILRILHESKTEVVSAALAKQLDVSTARIATALNTLERKGYIERTPSQNDGRKVVITLTPRGSEALEEREKEANALVNPLFARLTEDEKNTFFTLLKKLLAE